MTAGAQGIATLTFDAAPQAAQTKAVTTVTDSNPNPGMLVETYNVRGSFGVGGDGANFINCVPSTALCQRTTDGITWQDITLPLSAGWSHCVSGNGILVMVTGSGTTACLASSDGGNNWTQGTAPALGSIVFGLCFGNGVFCISGSSTASSATSTDGINWTLGSAWPTAFNWTPVFGNGVFVASAGANTISSTDGLNWTTRTTLPDSGAWTPVVFGNGMFMRVAADTNGYCSTSTDGINWTTTATYPQDAGGAGLAFANGLFISNATVGRRVFTSTDGLSWTASWVFPSYTVASPGVNYNRWVYVPSTSRFLSIGTSNAFVYLPANTRTESTTNAETKPALPSPGSNVATTAVTGQTGLLSTDAIEAWVQGSDFTSSHNAYEHKIAPIKLMVTNIVPDVGFDIVGLSEHRLTGDFQVRWAWAR